MGGDGGGNEKGKSATGQQRHARDGEQQAQNIESISLPLKGTKQKRCFSLLVFMIIVEDGKVDNVSNF